MLSVLTLATLGFGVGGALADGPMGWSISLLAVATGLTLIAAARSLVGPVRRQDLRPRHDGTVVIESPALIAWALVGAWAALLGVAGLWVWVAVTDFDAIESPGFTLVTVVGALASLPDLVRLLTGRLHRWRLTLGPEALTYRGYHTDETIAWTKIHGAGIQERGPAGVLVDRKGTGADLVIPITAFTVPPEQIIEEIQQRVGVRRR
ncbi:hypothetical protein GCM10027026_26430 [Myroides odoratimimus subsp. xuanwuensis]